jgi:hypothetical protein
MANIGSFDRTLRFLVGTTLLMVPFLGVFPMPLADSVIGRYAIAGVGVVLLLTATFRFCPAYALLGLQTCAQGGK